MQRLIQAKSAQFGRVDPNTASTAIVPPSRDDNPFATCWTRPGAIPFCFPEGVDADCLIARLGAAGWRGAIVGAHGSGKSTLVEHLKPRLVERGCRIVTISARGRSQRVEQANPAQATDERTLWIVDGFEQMGILDRARVRWRAQRMHCGLLMTSHADTIVPTLIELQPSLALIQRVVRELSARSSVAVPPEAVIASHASHGSNVREILFDLYERHERLRRVKRTQSARGA